MKKYTCYGGERGGGRDYAMGKKMIQVEGYKAFRGTMAIEFKCRNGENKIVTIRGDWLFKPVYNCWYNGGRSYPAECCRVISVE